MTPMSKNQVMKQRSLTGLIFGVLVLSFIFLGKVPMVILCGLICIVSVAEILMMKGNKLVSSLLYGSFTFLIATSILYFFKQHWSHFLVILIITISINLFLLVNLYNAILRDNALQILALVSVVLGMGLITVYIFSENYNTYLWFTIILTLWASDSFAYLVGSRIGKNKLFPKVSPGKTWEGFIAAGVFAIPICYFLFRYLVEPHSFHTLSWLLLSLTIWIFGTTGDLVESKIKRTLNKKDSGRILPGHGGIYDRFDSLIFTAPFIILILSI